MLPLHIFEISLLTIFEQNPSHFVVGMAMVLTRICDSLTRTEFGDDSWL